MPATKLKVVSNNGAHNPIYNSIKRFSLEGLGDLIRILMENVDDALFQLSDKVDNDRERTMYFEAMRQIRLKRDALQQQFDEEVQQGFDRALLGKKMKREEQVDTGPRLLENDDLEDSIAIRNMISRARPQFENELFAVGERLKLVLKRDSLEADDNPLDPQAICDCFHKASASLETDIQVKLIFYKLFERHVIANLGHFYHEVNALFVNKGVLPGFAADRQRMKQSTRFMTNRIKDKASAQPGNDQPPSGLNSNSAGAPTKARLRASLQKGVSGNAQQDSVTPDSSSYFTPTEFARALGNLQGVALANRPLATIQPQHMRAATQQQLLAFRKQNRHQINDADDQTIDVVSTLFDFFYGDDTLPEPIKVLIGRLQIPILKVAIIEKDFFNQTNHPARKLLDSLSRAALGWSENPADEQALIDTTEKVVNFLISKFADDISVFEKAYIDFEKFRKQQETESDNALKALALKEQERDAQIEAARSAATKLIAKLTHKRELSVDVMDFFETTWSTVLFNAYLSLGESSNHWRNLKRISTTLVWTLVPKHSEEERSKIIKTIPALLRALSKGMELIRVKAEVQNRIFQMLAGEHARTVKLTSKNIVTRVDDKTIWPEDGGAAAFARAAGINPIESAGPEPTADAVSEENILGNEVDNESITIISAAPADTMIDYLDQFTVGVKQGRIRVSEEIVMESEDGDDLDLMDSDEYHLKQAQIMEIGSWVEFTESESKVVTAQLSWKNSVSGNLVFVNRQGHKVRNLTTNAFAIELRAGRAKPVESSSVFDRAIHTIMSKM